MKCARLDMLGRGAADVTVANGTVAELFTQKMVQVETSKSVLIKMERFGTYTETKQLMI